MRKSVSSTPLQKGPDPVEKKKRSNRSKSKPKDNDNENDMDGAGPSRQSQPARLSPSAGSEPVTLKELDSTFASFDFQKYQREVEELQRKKNSDLRGIVDRKYDEVPRDRTKTKTIHNSRNKKSTERCPVEVEVIMPPPAVPSTSTFTSQMDDGLSPTNSRLGESYCEMTEESVRTTVSATQEEGDIIIDELDKFDQRFCQSYLHQQGKIEGDPNLTNIEKLGRINKLYREWISDLFEQVDAYYNAMLMIQQTAEQETLEAQLVIEGLKEDLEVKNQQVQQCKAAVPVPVPVPSTVTDDKIKSMQTLITTLKQKLSTKDKCIADLRRSWDEEERGNKEKIHNLGEMLADAREREAEKEAELGEVLTDLQNLTKLVERLQDDGVWNLEGLDESPMFLELFRNHEHLIGKRMVLEELVPQRYCCYEHEDCKYASDEEEFSEQRQQLLADLDQYKEKIFLKERRIQQLNIEEQAIKMRIKNAEIKELAMRSQIKEIKGTGLAIYQNLSTSKQMGRDWDPSADEALNEFWRMMSSVPDY